MYHLQLFYIRPSAALSQSCRLLLKIDRMEVVEVVGRGAVTLPPDRANNPGRHSLAPRTPILIRNPHWKKEREIKFYVLCSLVYITQASWYIVSGILSFTARGSLPDFIYTDLGFLAFLSQWPYEGRLLEKTKLLHWSGTVQGGEEKWQTMSLISLRVWDLQGHGMDLRRQEKDQRDIGQRLKDQERSDMARDKMTLGVGV